MPAPPFSGSRRSRLRRGSKIRAELSAGIPRPSSATLKSTSQSTACDPAQPYSGAPEQRTHRVLPTMSLSVWAVRLGVGEYPQPSGLLDLHGRFPRWSRASAAHSAHVPAEQEAHLQGAALDAELCGGLGPARRRGCETVDGRWYLSWSQLRTAIRDDAPCLRRERPPTVPEYLYRRF